MTKEQAIHFLDELLSRMHPTSNDVCHSFDCDRHPGRPCSCGLDKLANDIREALCAYRSSLWKFSWEVAPNE